MVFEKMYRSSELPPSVAALVEELSATRGVLAVALGGSRALGVDDSASDWDIGLYYRGAIDLTGLAARGDVHPPGTWGRLMNGGAWLQCDGHRVDVLLRDLDTVEHWTAQAERGEFDVDALLGYIAGAPTYMLAAELASCHVLHGVIPNIAYPQRLIAAGPPRWRFCRSFSAAYARAHAKRGNVAGATAQLVKAALEEAHARLCERGEWVSNEKRLLTAARLDEIQPLFSSVPTVLAELVQWVDLVASQLGCRSKDMPPWAAD